MYRVLDGAVGSSDMLAHPRFAGSYMGVNVAANRTIHNIVPSCCVV